jgi:hypothetical protein
MASPPHISVKFVGPDDKVRPGRQPTREEIGLRDDMSQFYSLRATLEALFGRPIYTELKERPPIRRIAQSGEKATRRHPLRAGPGYLNRISASISPASVGVRAAPCRDMANICSGRSRIQMVSRGMGLNLGREPSLLSGSPRAGHLLRRACISRATH